MYGASVLRPRPSDGNPNFRCFSKRGLAFEPTASMPKLLLFLLSSGLCCFAVNRCKKNSFQTIEVSSPPGTIISTVEQQFSLLWPNFDVKDPSGKTLLYIDGPFWTYSCGSDVNFPVRSFGKRACNLSEFSFLGKIFKG